MPTLGISDSFANSLLNTLRNVPYVVPITCVQLHKGIPGAAGTTLQSAVTARSACVFTAASAAGISIAGDLPTWNMTTAETITHISVWSGFDGDVDAVFLWSASVKAPRVVANGDVVTLNSNDLSFLTRAA